MTEPTPIRENSITQPGSLTIGQLVNVAARADVFSGYQQRKAKNTLRRQRADLALFAEFLRTTGDAPGDLFTDSNAWTPITWGLASAFVRWQLHQGYRVSSANVRLSTVKTYAKLAFQAGALDGQEFALIKIVSGYRRSRRVYHLSSRVRAPSLLNRDD